MNQKFSRRAVVASILPVASTVIGFGKPDKISVAANDLADDMARRHGGAWRAHVDHESGFILIKPRRRRRVQIG